eukprot:gnl/TRDRNA2_/TRDRNA2_90733_c1_seq1.p1 gnl/TRDRNA2_/TRDRNA2_90733_c1~~gnl/TRDRNA2_/TRDRNA2_90733_c1_seq1.p1  ORF type:complete len:485 (+),score=83.94 gnl/TRDRNA2_/TRDRNA2_90733_c1_seq1:69-1457(+)
MGEGEAGTGQYNEHWTRWHNDHPDGQEWHLSYSAIREVLAPHIRRAAAGGSMHIIDIGCGSSNWGAEFLADQPPGARLMLVDTVVPLIQELRSRHASDQRIECIVGDCRELEKVEGISAGTYSVVLDKGTTDALHVAAEQLTMLQGALKLLRKPHGVFISVSFASAKRVLLLRRMAEEQALRIQLRMVPAGPSGEPRLLAVLGEWLGSDAEERAEAFTDAFTLSNLDRLLYAGPLRGEPIIRFTNDVLPATMEFEQEEPTCEARVGACGADDATGHVVWPAAHALATHLCAHKQLVEGRRVVELGAGTGLVGLVAAALGAQEVILTDLPGAMPLLHRNTKRNEAVCGDRARAMELPWGAELGAGFEAGTCDVVIGCEIIYQHDAETCSALVDTMSQLIAPTGVCLIAYEFRDGMVADAEFFDCVNSRFDVEVMSLGKYGFGASLDDDDRLLYIYRPLPQPTT